MQRKMFSTLILASLVVLTVCSPVPASDEGLTATLVDVYPAGARMTFEIQASGVLETDLPMTIDKESLRVTPGDGVTVKDISVIESPRVGWIPPALQGLADEVEQAKAEVDRLEARSAALEQSIKLLDQAPPEGLDSKELTAYIDAASSKRENVELKLSQTAVLLEKARLSHNLMKAELDKRMPPQTDKVLHVRIDLSGKGACLLSGWSNDARWRPRYRMDLDSSSGAIKALMRPEVIQKTGITWKGDIRLHTVRPKESLTAPDPDPLVVDLRREPSYAKSDARALMMEMEEGAMPAPAAGNAPVVEEGLSDVILKAGGTVPGFGEPVRLDVGTFSLESAVSLLCVPEWSPEAWTVATVERLDRAVLAGECDLFIDGDDSGSTWIENRSAGQDIVIPFGRTPLVTASREEMIPKEGSSWIGKGRMQRGYVIKVTNGLPRETEVKVIDRLPIPAQESITVGKTELKPEPAEHADNGILTWNFKLPAGGSEEISVSYQVTWPGSEEIVFR